MVLDLMSEVNKDRIKKEQMVEVLEICVDRMMAENGSDIYIQSGLPPAIRNKVGEIVFLNDLGVMKENDVHSILEEIIEPEQFNKKMAQISQGNEVDFISVIKGKRFRSNACSHYSGQGIGIFMRYIPDEIPEFDTLGLPIFLKDLFRKASGLILICGPTGSGKTTTLASILNEINKEQRKHIITIEDPIEFIIPSKKSFITQRQLDVDTKHFSMALRAALREDPDVIMLGEMRDRETISAALHAVNTGHLVLSTLHTYSSKQTIERVLNVFSGDERQEIKLAFAFSLVAVVIQRLLPKADGTGKVLAYEILLNNKSVENAIIQDKVNQIENIMYQGRSEGMVLLNETLKNLLQSGVIDKNTALGVSYNPKELADWIRMK